MTCTPITTLAIELKYTHHWANWYRIASQIFHLGHELYSCKDCCPTPHICHTGLKHATLKTNIKYIYNHCLTPTQEEELGQIDVSYIN